MIDGLTLTERGRTLAALRLLGPIAAAARLRSPLARLHLERLCDPAERACEEAALSSLVPAHLERVEPSWYAAPESSTSAPATRYLARVAYGALVSMDGPVRAQGRHAIIDELLEGPVERLLHALVVVGRRRVAIAFTGAPRSALAQLLARLGEPEASRLAAEVRAIPPGVSAEDVKGAQRALFRSGATPHDDESGALFFQRVGVGWLAPLAAGTGAGTTAGTPAGSGDRARRIAQRLPRALGEILLGEREHPLPEGERSALLRLCATIPLS